LFDKNNIDKLFAIAPTIKSLLFESQNYKTARYFLRTYLGELTHILNKRSQKIQPLEWELQMSSVRTFKKIITVRSERLTKYNIIKIFWQLAHNKLDELPPDLNDGFFEEMIQLFKGILGKSGIYSDMKAPEFSKKTGTEAALVRSDQLDEMGSLSLQNIKKYASGLEDDIKLKRQNNKERILKYFKATPEDWNRYVWHIQNVIRDVDTLNDLIDLTNEEKEAIKKAATGKLPFGITPYYISLMDKDPSRKLDHAVRAQVIPPLHYVETMLSNKQSDVSFDFMMENETSPIDLITRRYPHIAILKPYNTCSQICVYCQRNWEIDDVLDRDALATKEKILAAIQWLREHPVVTEVLLTGGDPLVMQTKRLKFILDELSTLKHITRIRIGSRTFVALPQRITDNLANLLASYHIPGQREIVFVTHFEHPYEITPECMNAAQKIKTRGMSIYNQAVFTLENSRRFELVALRNMLRLIGVDPYYTFNTKGKEETRNYRVPMARLQQEIKEEARLMPGIVRTDEAVYNVPKLGKNYLRAQQHHTLLTILPNGRRVYEFHPWEKNLSLADTYIDTDVSIHDFLQELEKRGDNKNDYQSIWYYY
jgi:lysine 2,3-aminomutase